METMQTIRVFAHSFAEGWDLSDCLCIWYSPHHRPHEPNASCSFSTIIPSFLFVDSNHQGHFMGPITSFNVSMLLQSASVPQSLCCSNHVRALGILWRSWLVFCSRIYIIWQVNNIQGCRSHCCVPASHSRLHVWGCFEASVDGRLFYLIYTS